MFNEAMAVFGQTDYPVTRQLLIELDDWIAELASPLVPLKKSSVELEHVSGFMWEFWEESERSLLVGKAVRMASGIRVAMLLADLGFINCRFSFMTASGRSGRLDAMRRRPNAERARYLSALDGQVLIRPGIGDAVVEEAVRYFGARRRGP